MATVSQLAKLAFSEAQISMRRATGTQNTDLLLADDRLADSAYYVEDGFRVLTEIGNGWDPYVNARATAEQAVLTFAKLKLMGDSPEANPIWINSVRQWRRAAAVVGAQDL